MVCFAVATLCNSMHQVDPVVSSARQSFTARSAVREKSVVQWEVGKCIVAKVNGFLHIGVVTEVKTDAADRTVFFLARFEEGEEAVEFAVEENFATNMEHAVLAMFQNGQWTEYDVVDVVRSPFFMGVLPAPFSSWVIVSTHSTHGFSGVSVRGKNVVENELATAFNSEEMKWVFGCMREHFMGVFHFLGDDGSHFSVVEKELYLDVFDVNDRVDAVMIEKEGTLVKFLSSTCTWEVEDDDNNRFFCHHKDLTRPVLPPGMHVEVHCDGPGWLPGVVVKWMDFEARKDNGGSGKVRVTFDDKCYDGGEFWWNHVRKMKDGQKYGSSSAQSTSLLQNRKRKFELLTAMRESGFYEVSEEKVFLKKTLELTKLMKKKICRMWFWIW